MALDGFESASASPGDWAHMYREVGLQVVPAVSPGEQKPGQGWKRPRLTDWTQLQDKLLDAEHFEGWYGASGKHASRRNMGLITGQASNGVFCLDLDVKPGAQAMEWWAGLIAVHANDLEPETPAQRTGGGGRQLIFRAPQGWVAPTFKTTTFGVDVRGQGGFMMAPPSLHESGKFYEWEDGREPWSCAVEVAPDWLIEAIEKVREQHGGGAPGAPRERTVSEGAKNAFGLDIDDREDKMARAVWGVAISIRQALAHEPHEPMPADYMAEADAAWERYLSTTKTRLPFGPGDTNASLLDHEGRGRTDWNRKLARAMKLWNGKLGEAAGRPNPNAKSVAVIPVTEQNQLVSAVSTVNETPLSLFDPWERYLVPKFPLDTLIRPLRRFVEFQAASTGADVSAVAMAALTACAGAIDQRAELRMKRTGQWRVRPRLWTVLVGDPSSKKTPVISACTRPLRAAENVNLRQHAKDMARWEAEKKEDKDAIKPPEPTRFLVNDTTTEKLGELLSKQDRGILVEHDELSGWIGAMDKYSGGKGSSADRAFWAQAYNGGPKNVDRLGRGSTYIENLCVSFLGGIQPDRLSQLSDLTSDGLLQRFLPVMMAKSSFPQEVEDETPIAGFDALIASLQEIKPGVARMTAEALEEAEKLQRYLYDLEHMDGLGKSICTFAGKLAGVHGSLALVLHCTDDASGAMYDPLEASVVARASRILREFCIPHAMELYRSAGDQGDWDHLRALASFVLTSEKERFTAADFTSGVRGLRGAGTWELTQKLSPLVAGGWLVEVEGGKAWAMVGDVREALSDRREAEKARKAEVVATLRGLRGE